MARGRYIVLEGGEGVGKTTQVRRLAHRLTDWGLDVLTLREPGGDPFAEAGRRLLLGRLPRTAEVEGQADGFGAPNLHGARMVVADIAQTRGGFAHSRRALVADLVGLGSGIEHHAGGGDADAGGFGDIGKGGG